jgi:hypothetical protein
MGPGIIQIMVRTNTQGQITNVINALIVVEQVEQYRPVVSRTDPLFIKLMLLPPRGSGKQFPADTAQTLQAPPRSSWRS